MDQAEKELIAHVAPGTLVRCAVTISCKRSVSSRSSRIPKDDVDPQCRRLDGVKYLATDQWLAMKAVLKVVVDALSQAGKKWSLKRGWSTWR